MADTVAIEIIAELFDEPCNYTFFEITIDDFMYSECGDWCESNCDKVPAVECWKQFFKAWEERKDEWTK